jgi:hypothetical protein
VEKLYIKIVAQTRKSRPKRTGLESHYFGQREIPAGGEKSASAPKAETPSDDADG